MLQYGWNRSKTILVTGVISLIALAGPHWANGSVRLQETYNFTDRRESAEVQGNRIATPIQQNELENVPPDVLKAIYPNRNTSATSAPTPSFFDQSNSTTFDETRIVPTPTRFNDSLVTNQEPRISRQESPSQPLPAQTAPIAASSRSANDLTGFRGLIEQPLNAQNEAIGNVRREVQVDPEVIRASHADATSFERAINPYTSSMKEPDRSAMELPRMKETDIQEHSIMNSRNAKSRIENAPQPATSSPSLSAMLAESNREVRQQKKGSLTREKSPAQDSRLPSDDLGAGIDLGKKIQEISLGLCMVLGIGVGFILLAKLWFRSSNRVPDEKGQLKNDSRKSAAKIHLTTSLRLDSKSTLHLVEAANQRVLVATDLNGIKSVVALTPSFESELGSMFVQENSPLSAKEQETEPKDDFDEIYSPVPRQYQPGRKLETRDQDPVSKYTGRETQSKKSPAELETEMRRQLAELLGGQAFKDVFMQQTSSGKR